MDKIIDFIVENIWVVIVGLVFLSGLKKSKKQKGEPVNEPQDLDYEFEDEDYSEWGDENKQSPSSRDFDSMPIPQPLKNLLQELDDKPFKKRDSPWEQQPMPMGHFDTPMGDEGKEIPHETLRPTNTMEADFAGEGKFHSKRVVFPENSSTNVPKVAFSYDDKINAKDAADAALLASVEKDAYAPKLAKVGTMTRDKLIEAVIMSEILGKPLAMRKRG